MMQTRARRVIFHVDVGPEEGWGHLREALAVAEVLSSRGVASGFVLPTEAEEAREVVVSSGHSSIGFLRSESAGRDGWCGFREVLLRESVSFLVSNLVSTSSDYASTVQSCVGNWAVITEHADDELAPLNYNISLHPSYMPLSHPYRDGPRRRHKAQLEELLICLGGSDPKNVTGLTLEMLRQGFERSVLPEELKIVVILGPLFRHARTIHAMSDSYPVPLLVVGPLRSEEVADHISKADAGITTGGGCMYEFCSLGLPSVILPILDKMVANGKVLAARGAVSLLDRVDRISADELVRAVAALLPVSVRCAVGNAGQDAVDGRGAERIADDLVQTWGLA